LEFYPQFFRGSHLYEYDPANGSLRDMNAWDKSVMAPGNGQQYIAIDYHHDRFSVSATPQATCSDTI
jgi:hypothetical protein